MLTGEKPYVGATTEEILEQHRNAAVPSLPPDLAAYQPLLNKLLAKDPSAALRQRARGARGVAAYRAAGDRRGADVPALAG